MSLGFEAGWAVCTLPTMFDLPFPIMVYRLLAGAYSMPVLSLSGVLKESNLLKHPMQFLGVSIRPIKPLE